MLEWVAEEIKRLERDHSIRVAIDGIDCAGKTIFADELSEVLKEQGLEVIRASLDGFHNPREFRYVRGKDSHKGYYLDSFNYKALFKYLLNPLGPGGSKEYRTQVFDYKKDEWVKTDPLTVPNDAVLIFDGVFLLRPELDGVWDLRIYLDIDYNECLRRAVERDDGDPAAIRYRYEVRYIPGQKLYHKHANPRRKADLIINNTDPENPEVTG